MKKRRAPKNAVCLWYKKDALKAAKFYASVFPDTRITAVHKVPSDFPSGKKGQILTVEC
jgi:predicted 3-demethylubiquinone-9 3-methyltransferase (glyoxalase superfamily)